METNSGLVNNDVVGSLVLHLSLGPLLLLLGLSDTGLSLDFGRLEREKDQRSVRLVRKPFHGGEGS